MKKNDPRILHSFKSKGECWLSSVLCLSSICWCSSGLISLGFLPGFELFWLIADHLVTSSHGKDGSPAFKYYIALLLTGMKELLCKLLSEWMVRGFALWISCLLGLMTKNVMILHLKGIRYSCTEEHLAYLFQLEVVPSQGSAWGMKWACHRISKWFECEESVHWYKCGVSPSLLLLVS